MAFLHQCGQVLVPDAKIPDFKAKIEIRYFGIGIHIHASDLSLSQTFSGILATLVYKYDFETQKNLSHKQSVLYLGPPYFTTRTRFNSKVKRFDCAGDFPSVGEFYFLDLENVLHKQSVLFKGPLENLFQKLIMFAQHYRTRTL